jgi:hypothetical protein
MRASLLGKIGNQDTDTAYESDANTAGRHENPEFALAAAHADWIK